ncbi:MAG: DUF853 family protein [Rhizobiales bacterium]|nr:DUF853 family protein [Hyphomicrobiales bacterium]
MYSEDSVFIGKSQKEEELLLKLANRHGLIAGATGTGKTVSLQILAEGFAADGVPVFVADVKGDLAGLAVKGEDKDFLAKRAKDIGFDGYELNKFPVVFWDLFGEQGHPIRTTISDMGPLLLSRLLNLNETQEGVINIAFRVADDLGLLLLDLKDLKAMLVHIGENSKDFTLEYGNVSRTSIGSIQRRLLTLKNQGGDNFFGEPALDIQDFLKTNSRGEGYVNILAADKLMQSPQLYATFLLWLLSELFEELPEVGDADKPKLVFFFDEAHLLFDDAPKALIQKIEQVVKLIRSKGVGVYFVTQNPTDVPDAVLAQLSNRIQHALRAYTPREQKAVKVAAETFRTNPDFDCYEAITLLSVGEALVSTLEEKGVPSMVQRTMIRPPSSRMGPISTDERRDIIENSHVYGKYEDLVDRDSAYETFKGRAIAKVTAEKEVVAAKLALKAEVAAAKVAAKAEKDAAKAAKLAEKAEKLEAKEAKQNKQQDRGFFEDLLGGAKGSKRQGYGETVAKSILRSVSTRLAGAIVRGILGSFKKGF